MTYGRQAGGREMKSMHASQEFDSNGAGTIPFAERLTCTVTEACRATGIGRTKLYELMNGGYVKTQLVGRRRLVLVTSLLRLMGQEPRQARSK